MRYSNRSASVKAAAWLGLAIFLSGLVLAARSGLQSPYPALALAGLALFAATLGYPFARCVAGGLAIVLAVICVLAFPHLPFAFAGLLCFAAAVGVELFAYRRSAATALRCLSGLLLAVAVAGAAFDLFRLDAIFPSSGELGLAAAAAAGLLALALGCWLSWRGERWNRHPLATAQADHILSVAAAVLIAAVCAAALVSFTLMWHVERRDSIASLVLRRDEHVHQIEALLAAAREHGLLFAERESLRWPRLGTIAAPMPLPSRDAAAVLYDSHQRLRAAAGAGSIKPELELAVAAGEWLLWRKGFYLRQALPAVRRGRRLGTVVIEQPVALLSAAGFETSWGRTGEMMLCGLAEPAANTIRCFPAPDRPRPFVIARTSNGAQRPIALALDGHAGVLEAPDSHGRRALSAYAPIPGLNLALVVKMDTTEAFATTRRQLELMLPLLLILIWGGFEVLRRQMRPLVHQLVQSRNQALDSQARLAELAETDSLTGLANRSAFFQRLRHAMEGSRRLHRQALLALLYLDLDFFKNVNDTLGHSQGDRLLGEIALRLRHCVRSADTVARLGGDEFTILLENLDGPADAERVVAAIHTSLQTEIALAPAPVVVSSSIGVAFYRGEEVTADELVRRADAALYAAKRAGRATHRVFPAEQVA